MRAHNHPLNPVPKGSGHSELVCPPRNTRIGALEGAPDPARAEQKDWVLVRESDGNDDVGTEGELIM
jgi:hypothetical protein